MAKGENVDIRVETAEETLHAPENQFEKIFRSSPAAMAITEINTGLTLKVNDSYISMSGYSSDELIGRTSAERGTWVDPKDRSRVIEVLKRKGFVRDLEVKVRTKDRQIITVLFSAEKIELEGKQCLLSTSIDVTERKRLEEDRQRVEVDLRRARSDLELRVEERTQELNQEIAERKLAEANIKKSESRLESILEASPYGIAIIADGAGNRLYCNPRFNEMFAGDPDISLVGTDISDSYVDPEDLISLRRIARGKLFRFDAEILRKRLDGSQFWCQMHSRPIEYWGEKAHVVWHFDITERKKSEEKLRSLGAAIDELDANFTLYDSKDRLLICNQNHRDLNQAVAESIMPGKTFGEFVRAIVAKGLVPEASGRETEWVQERIARHQNPKGPFEVQRQDGIWLLVHEQRLPDGSIISIGTDVTERKSMVEALRVSEERHRSFAADVAHELRTPLAVLRTQLDSLGNKDEADSLRKDVDAMARMVAQLLAIARLEFLEVPPSDLADIVQVCTDVASHLAPLAVKEDRLIEVTGNPGPVLIRGNTDALEQAVRNLVENAIRYSARGMTVTVDIGDNGTVRVIDRGKGVPLHVRENIFQRFKRADQRGDGAGLGLAIVKRTVEAHDGSISVDDNAGGGAVFTLHFPADRLVSLPRPSAAQKA